MQVNGSDGAAGITWSLWLRAASPGVNQQVILWRWILSSQSSGCDVIVYYPTASVGNRELAGGLAAGELCRPFDASVLLKCP